MAKAPENTEASSRIAALEEWSRSTAESMDSVNERLGFLEEKSVVAERTGNDHDATFAHVRTRLEALEKQMGDAAHVSRATAENGSVSDDVFARIKRLEAHAGLKDARTADGE